MTISSDMKLNDLGPLLHSGGSSLIYRGVQESGEEVVYKVLRNENPNSSQIERFVSEFDYTRRLDLPAVRKALSRIVVEGRQAVVLRYFPGCTFGELFGEDENRNNDFIADFLSVATLVCDAVAAIHRAGVLHCDLTPENILVSEDRRSISLIDFGIAMDIPESGGITVDRGFSGTVSCVSPEQTGRINRMPDERSDLYSLGVCFYRALCGRFPFEGSPSRVIHAHLSQQPEAVSDLNNVIPDQLSHIIQTLLKKEPDARYATAEELGLDFRHCLQQLQQTGTIPSFILSCRCPDSAGFERRLYCRDDQLKMLEEAYGKFRQGENCAVSVSGASGTGKTSLIRELELMASLDEVIFVQGKFTKYSSRMPYAAVFDSIADFLRQLLLQPEELQFQFRKEINSRLGENISLLADLIPEFSFFSDVHHIVEPIEPEKQKDRLLILLKELLAGGKKIGMPLILFLDDLQWAGKSDLDLILYMAGELNDTDFILAVAYRDDEAGEEHPLHDFIRLVVESGYPVCSLATGEFDEHDICEIISEMSGLEKSRAVGYARALYGRTGGLPLDVIPAATRLVQEIRTQTETGGEPERIVAAVVDEGSIAAVSLQELEPGLRRILAVAASLGAGFSLDLLADATGSEQADIAEALLPAVRSGALFKDMSGKEQGPQKYRFVHDRIQEAAYNYLSGAEQEQLHLETARCMAGLPDPGEDRILALVFQYRLGGEIPDQRERMAAADFALRASGILIGRGEYSSASEIMEYGMRLLPENSWAVMYRRALEMHTGMARAAYLAGEDERFDRVAALISHQAKDILDTVPCRIEEINRLMVRGESSRAVDLSYELLAKIGFHFTKAPGKVKVMMMLRKLRQTMAEKKPDWVREAPLLKDRRLIAALDIIEHIGTALYYSDSIRFLYLGIEAVTICLKNGITGSVAWPVATIGMFLTARGKNIEEGLRYAGAALEIEKRCGIRDLRTRVIALTYLGHFKSTLPDIGRLFQEDLLKMSLAQGDREIYETSLVNDIAIKIQCAVYLPEVRIAAEESIRQIQDKGMLALSVMNIYRQKMANLTETGISRPALLDGEFCRCGRDLCNPDLGDNIALAAVYDIHMLHLSLLFSDEEMTETVFKKLLPEHSLLLCSPLQMYYQFYACIAALRLAGKKKRRYYLRLYRKNIRALSRSASVAPFNYLHKQRLAEAEYARFRRKPLAALKLYEKSLQLARENGFRQDEGLCAELAGQYCLELGYRELSRSWLRRAWRAYRSWGAAAKLEHMESEYGAHLFVNIDTSGSGGQSESGGDFSTGFDAGSLINAARAISGIMDVEKLLGRIMEIILINSGSRYGCFVLDTGEGLMVRADATERVPGQGPEADVYPAQNISTFSSLPVTMIRDAAETGKLLIHNSAEKETAYDDPKLKAREIGSAACVPMRTARGLQSIVYLENKLIKGLFTPSRLRAVEVLTAQGAIALDNAFLFNDINQRKETLEDMVQERTVELEAALKAAEDANRAKSEYLGMAAHDLKNPVLVMDMYSSFLENNLKEELSEEQHRHLDNIRNSSKQMYGMLNGLLDAAKIEDGRLELDLRPCDFRKFILECAEHNRILGQERGIAISVIIPDVLPEMDMDYFRLQQVMNNLLQNGIRHTHDNTRVDLRVYLKDDEVVTEVADHGDGIPEDRLPLVFTKFYSKSVDFSGKNPGFGLGLAIVKMIVEEHGGRIEAFNDPGNGAVFRMRLPVLEDF